MLASRIERKSPIKDISRQSILGELEEDITVLALRGYGEYGTSRTQLRFSFRRWRDGEEGGAPDCGGSPALVEIRQPCRDETEGQPDVERV